MKTYDESNVQEITALLEGRRIVAAEAGDDIVMPKDDDAWWSHVTTPVGRLTLDDGTVIYVAGHEGGCSCSAGCYYLEHVATVDNVITAVRIKDSPAGDDDMSGEGVYAIYVVADAGEINVAQFEGSDGNGYYGTGFELVVVGGE